METGPVPPNPEVSVVVPVYGNVDTLRELYDRVRGALESRGLSFEIIFVDDACPNGSRAVVEDLARCDARVGGLALARNVGQHHAVMTGLHYARGHWVVVMDADLQDPPDAIPLLLSKGRAGFAAVFAGRRGRYESAPRLLTARVYRAVLHRLCGVPRDAGLFVAMNRQMLERLLAMAGGRPSLVAMMGCAGLSLASQPVERSRRTAGSSTYGFVGRLRAGILAVVWVIHWNCCRVHRQPRSSGRAAPVKAYIGARFGLPNTSTVGPQCPGCGVIGMKRPTTCVDTRDVA